MPLGHGRAVRVHGADQAIHAPRRPPRVGSLVVRYAAHVHRGELQLSLDGLPKQIHLRNAQGLTHCKPAEHDPHEHPKPRGRDGDVGGGQGDHLGDVLLVQEVGQAPDVHHEGDVGGDPDARVDSDRGNGVQDGLPRMRGT